MGKSTYPNPSSTTITFSIDSEEKSSLRIYNTLGQTIKEVSTFQNNFIWDIKNESIQSGIYYYTIQTNETIRTGKLIVNSTK